MPSGPVYENTESAWNPNFISGILTLVEGRHITQKDENVSIISRELAEENSLHLGDKLSFSEPSLTVKVIGIYKSGPSMEFDHDTIFTDLETLVGSIGWVDFFVADPAKLDTVMGKLKRDIYALQANTAEYDAISAQLATIGRLTTALIIATIVVSTTVLLLTLAMLISCLISYAATAQFQVYLRKMIGAVTVAIPARCFQTGRRPSHHLGGRSHRPDQQRRRWLS